MESRFTRTLITLGCLALVAFIFLSFSTAVPAGEDDDKTLSPYFFVKTDDPAIDQLPLKSTSAKVMIAGVIADVTVTQVYKNEGKKTLEAIYIFPGSTRAAVYALRMTVGERVIDAEIMERKEARATYERAKQEGKTASLLEQQRPNVFQMNVANILPGDLIKVELKYTELLEPEDRVYEFVYPTVVGPRYSNQPAAGAPDTDKWTQNPYLRQGEPAPYQFGLEVDLQTGVPIAELSSPSHKPEINFSSKTQAKVVVKDDPKAGTKDFVLRYKLAGGKIETGLLLYPGKDENFFLMMMEPPDRVKLDQVVPREYIFILDVSGSMNGFPLTEVAKPMMKEMIQDLRPNELMNVLLFSGGSAVMSEGRSLPADATNKQKALNWIMSQQGGGGTEILPALNRALALPRTEGYSRIIVIVTDGYVAVEPEVFELIRNNLGKANVFTFGIGTAVNRHLIEGMARVGLGESFVAVNQSEGLKLAKKFRDYIESPVLTSIKVGFKDFEAYDLEPLAVPDLFAQRPVVVVGKYKGSPAGRIAVFGKTASGDFEKALEVDQGSISPDNSALRLLWARHKIMRISDLNSLVSDPRRVKEVTDLGLKYGIMTQYTSFVAVDKVKRADGTVVTVKQPLPLPEGVSNLAVGDGGRGMAMTGGKYMRGGPRMSLAPTAPSPGNYGPMTTALKPSAPKEETDAAVRVTEKKDKEKELLIVSVEEVRGAFSRSEVEKALKDQEELLEACLKKSTNNRQVKDKGEVVFSLVIGPDGKIKDIKMVTSTLEDVPTQVCFRTVLEQTAFPKPQSGEVTVVVKLSCKLK